MTILNEDLAREFLSKNSLNNCEIKKIAGDASFRSYYRIFSNDKTFVLMFAPPKFEDVEPFIKIDKFLNNYNLSAPKIIAQDQKQGFLLLEDFGDDTYGRVLAKTPSKQLEFDLYRDACDCLIELHKIENPQDVAPYNMAVLFREVMLFVDWYLPLQKKSISLKEKAQFKFLWFQLFDLLDKQNQVLVLRDYHADNLMVLESKKNHQRVGLLDFQDALIGSKAYDLVSLLEDARRDVGEDNRSKIFNYYLEKTKVDKLNFVRDYEILSLQRNIKIVGIFSRLSMRDNKHNYLDLLPRVLDFVRNRAFSANPIFSEIGIFLKNYL